MPDGEAPSQAPSQTLLRVRNLSVDLVHQPGGRLPILSDLSFEIDAGSIVGLYGESGCGKTTLALALLNLLPNRFQITGEIRLKDHDIVTLSSRQLERVRGAEIAMIFQDPLTALNPVLRAGYQVTEVLRAHGAWNRKTSSRDLDALFQLAGLTDRARIASAYPHQLSGGERQRVVIAQALACRPALVIADEPFTALDATLVVELAALFRDLRAKLRTSFLLISHSPGVLAATADSVLVMQNGRIVDRGAPRQVFASQPTAVQPTAFEGTADAH